MRAVFPNSEKSHVNYTGCKKAEQSFMVTERRNNSEADGVIGLLNVEGSAVEFAWSMQSGLTCGQAEVGLGKGTADAIPTPTGPTLRAFDARLVGGAF
jgi:hypothetical protein